MAACKWAGVAGSAEAARLASIGSAHFLNGLSRATVLGTSRVGAVRRDSTRASARDRFTWRSAVQTTIASSTTAINNRDTK